MLRTVLDNAIRIKNGYMASKEDVLLKYSRVSEQILSILVENKYIQTFETIDDHNKKFFKVILQYQGLSPAVNGIKIISKPGRKIYKNVKELKPVLGGLGLMILSTSGGIMTDSQARKNKCGGEALFEIW
jgi:small subunit ribosomal protein S8